MKRSVETLMSKINGGLKKSPISDHLSKIAKYKSPAHDPRAETLLGKKLTVICSLICMAGRFCLAPSPSPRLRPSRGQGMFTSFASQHATFLERGCGLNCSPHRMSPSLWEGRRLTDGEGLILPLAQRFHVIYSGPCSPSLAKL